MSDSSRFSLPDQQARFERAKENNDKRYLDITTVYDPTYLKGLRVAVTGANRGIGLDLATELTAQGAKVVAIVRSSSKELDDLNPAEIIKGVDVMDDEKCASIGNQVSGGPVDVLINNAGYFYEKEETVESMNFVEQMKTINICSCGPLRISAGFFNGGLLKEGSKIAMITSQGGSVEWRTVQNPNGHDYGHHMSKAAANMGSVLLAQEVKHKGVMVGIYHPGFNRTAMTAKYKDIWDVEGAVEPAIGAKRILHEIGGLSMDKSGKFINCEDGLEIPW